ncbi:MAG: molybdopterin-dependent oxidoreductase, partial [Burkholderiaceae bacterium]
IAWSEALDLIHEGVSRQVDRHGPQTVLPLNYAGPHGQLAGASMDRRFFHRLGATLLDRGPLCGGVRAAAYTSLFGNAPGLAPELAADADRIAIWGNNVTVSNLHMARVVKRVRDAGGRVLVVDPKRTKIAEQADLFLQIRPGTDVVLALALAAELERRGAIDRDFVARWVQDFEPYMAAARRWDSAAVDRVCGIDAERFAALADFYAGAKRLTLSIGNGIERGLSGGSALRAIMALNAITGHLGRVGTGIVARPGAAFPLTPAALQRPDLVPAGTRTVNIVDVAQLLTDDSLEPPIRAVFVYNHNPVCTHPDQNLLRRALSRPELFTVGCDVVMTDSMRYCDVVLPACTHFEHADLFAAYGQSYLQRGEPVIEPLDEALPNTEIFRRLAVRFGFDDPLFRDDDAALIDAAVDAADPRLEGLRPRDLPLDRALLMAAPDGEALRLCGNVAPKTASGKVELYSADLESRHGCGLPRFDPPAADRPFTLISPSSSRRTNTTFGADPASADAQPVEIHPDDAARAGVVDGQAVRVWNGLGEVALRARLSTSVAPGVLYVPKGAWLATSTTGQTVNALISANSRADICGGAAYNDTFVDIAPLPAA